jgi:hypothetical protein
MSKDLPKPTPERDAEKLDGTTVSTETAKEKARGLDFGKLDLSVERVDERLSPSETNIFDK